VPVSASQRARKSSATRRSQWASQRGGAGIEITSTEYEPRVTRRALVAGLDGPRAGSPTSTPGVAPRAPTPRRSSWSSRASTSRHVTGAWLPGQSHPRRSRPSRSADQRAPYGERHDRGSCQSPSGPSGGTLRRVYVGCRTSGGHLERSLATMHTALNERCPALCTRPCAGVPGTDNGLTKQRWLISHPRDRQVRPTPEEMRSSAA